MATSTENRNAGILPLKVDWRHPAYAEVYQERAARLSLLGDREVLGAMVAMYRGDPVQFISHWGMTVDPRGTPHIRPFILWPRQEDFIWWLDEHVRGERPRPGVVDKSRDCGVTWLCVAYSVWGWIFHGMQSGFGSRKEQLVDRLGDMDSIFEKIRFTISHVPSVFLSKQYTHDRDANHMKIVDPATGATITGEGGDNIGRGGRKTVYFVDESAYLERPQLAERALSQTTNARIDVSTHNGPGTIFAHKVKTYPRDDVFVFDWRDDPRKDDVWYARMKAQYDEVTIAQEIDRDPGASLEGVIIPGKWVSAARTLWGWLEPKDETGERRAGLDVADEGADENAIAFMNGPVLFRVDSWREGNTAQTARRALIHAREERVQNLRYDNIGVGAGVKGELSNHILHGLTVQGVNTGKAANPGWYIEPDPTLGDPGKKNEDMFLNFRAQAWWLLRRRFQRSYETVEGHREWSLSECIAISPQVPPEATDELSSLTYKTTTAGKIQVEGKDKLKARGIRSPNMADAIVLATCPDQKGKPAGKAGTWRKR